MKGEYNANQQLRSSVETWERRREREALHHRRERARTSRHRVTWLGLRLGVAAVVGAWIVSAAVRAMGGA